MFKIYTQKKHLRKKILDLSKKLDYLYKKRAGKKICDFVLSCSEYQNSKIIFCFIGMENEVDTVSIIQKAFDDGKIVAVPLIVSKGVMVAKQITSLENLKKNRFGILEPNINAETIEPAQIDFCVVPCLSCSHNGVRLGYGGGYYDRYMHNQTFVKACICYEKLTNDDIPENKFDERVDFLITEIGVYKFN